MFDLEYNLKACPDEPFRRDMFSYAEAIANVFTELNFAKRNLRERYLTDGEKFKVIYGDLTAEGYSFVIKSYRNWTQKTDRWKTGRTLEKLETSLKKEYAEYQKTLH